jgi:hypothetical protein
VDSSVWTIEQHSHASVRMRFCVTCEPSGEAGLWSDVQHEL